jgi:UDP-glucose 4-epimerase
MNRDAFMVLGATGFIGRKLVAALARDGSRVFAISRTAHLYPPSPNVEVFAQPLDDIALLKTLLPTCKMIFHLASDSTPGSTASQPVLEASLNLLPTLRLLELLQAFPEIPLVYVSSGGATYASTMQHPLDEAATVETRSYYGAGKIAAENFILAFVRQHRGTAIVLRPSNVYGPGQPYKRGFGIIPTIFRNLIDGTPMSIWGDGSTVRDYLYVHDFTRLCSALAGAGIAPGFAIYNIGSGTPTSINELCGLAENVTGIALKRNFAPVRTVDCDRIVLNSSRARIDFGWSATTPLQSGLQETWQWMKNHGT